MNETKSTCDSSFQDANKGIGAGFDLYYIQKHSEIIP